MSQSQEATEFEWADVPLEADRNEMDLSFVLCWNTNPSGNNFKASHDLCVDPREDKIWCEACGKHYHVGASNYSTMFAMDMLYICVKSGNRYECVEDHANVITRAYELGHMYWFPETATPVNAVQDSAAFISLDFRYMDTDGSRFTVKPMASWIRNIFIARFEDEE